MISGVHAILDRNHSDGVRALFGDVLGFSSVDAGGGWSIVALPPAELAVHPTDTDTRHEPYLPCDDSNATVDALQRKGVQVTDPVSDQGWGSARRSSSQAVASSACTSHGTPAHAIRRPDLAA